jgi:hypothetical protein
MPRQVKDGLGRRADASSGSGPTNPHLSVDEVIARYPGEWILMRVTAYEQGWPSRGHVLAHSHSRQEVSHVWSLWLTASSEADGPLYMFDAYPVIRTGDELWASLNGLWEVSEGAPDERGVDEPHRLAT